jgi:tetratricopeptide (TPR) repeat protein
MMYVKTRMAILTGIAFGIFLTLSCATADKVQTPAESNTVSESYNEQLLYLNQRIRSNPRNEEMRVQKAELLYEYAHSITDPEERKPVYQDLRVTADDSRSLPNAKLKIDEIVKRAWNSEQNSSIRLLQEDRSETYDIHFNKIIAHLNNAITIIPDSLVTYSLKSTTLYRRGHLNESISTLVEANRIARVEKPEIREKLAFLYMESGYVSDAIYIYEELTNQYPDRETYIHGLINALILNKQHDDAVLILRNLSDQYPARTRYRESLATELFYIFSSQANLIYDNPQAITASEDDISEALTILEEARLLFTSLDSQIPSNEENIFRMGTFYMKVSHVLHRLTGLDIGNELAGDLMNKSNEYMQKSLSYWERLAEMSSDNMEYMYILHSVYLELGMNEEADSIERTFNF